MAFLIIDRRQQGKQKSAVNRQRFLKRFRKHIKEAVTDAVNQRSITDMERGEEISIPKKDISEPIFHHGKGGKQRRILTGNKEFVRGDRIDRPKGGGGGGGGGEASDQGEGMDEFVFQLNQQEFLDFMFEDLELPNLVHKQLKDSDSYKLIKGGYSRDGIPARLNIVQSLRGAKARRIALGGAIRRDIKALEESLEALQDDDDSDQHREITYKLERARRRLNQIPFLDDFDLRYNNMIQQPTPTTSAVMFCLMDVSGSMTQDIKDLAKRFFVLLHLFLKRHYEKTEVVFIRHHTKADEVDEEEFFYSRETGGTVVSSALDLMKTIVQERYPTDSWNIYAAQASDGENWADDSPKCSELLVKSLLPLVQYYAYVEISSGKEQELWRAYDQVTEQFPDRFAMRNVKGPADIYPVFRDLFERKNDVSELIADSSDWTFKALEDFEREIGRIAADKYRLDTYPNQIEIISSEQMMDAYSSTGMPVGYHHWSYGKQFLSTEQRYRKGHMGLAYELVINSDPCIAYLMEENSMTLQALVIAHACFGHNSFFKGNYLFREWTDASAIVNYLLFARNYIIECEERHGVDAVESLLDSCHALMNLGVDRFRRPRPISPEEEQQRQHEREDYLQRQVNDLWRTIPKKELVAEEGFPRFPAEPQENLLYFVEKNAPLLEPWEREIVRIVRKIAVYYYPQRQTKIMNEGWATFWHYNLMNDLYDEGLITEGTILEFLQSHTNVVFQPEFDSPYYSGINPYTLGFAMFSDIRRVCENPTEEDRRFCTGYAGADWLDTVHHAMANYKDESFILQYLTPKVIRDLKLFAILDDDADSAISVTAIHDDDGYRRLREGLADQYNLSKQEPDIQVWEVSLRGDRSMTLQHRQRDRIPLDDDATKDVLKHLHHLWRFDVHLESLRGDALHRAYHCNDEKVWIDTEKGDQSEKSD